MSQYSMQDVENHLKRALTTTQIDVLDKLLLQFHTFNSLDHAKQSIISTVKRLKEEEAKYGES